MEDTKNTIYFADSRSMEEMHDKSVHLIVTSPPYWQLKDYDHGQQIGFHDSYEEYINNLNLVWKESHRILHDGCRLCINIGDQFARSVYYGRYKVIPIRTEIIKFCETIGFDYLGAIIWQKVTTCNTTGGATIMGSYPYPRNGIIKIDYEFILLFKKPGNPPKVSKEVKELSILTLEEWNEYFSGHWNFPGERQDKHLAMFPEELPKRLIKMFSFYGETILDPFLGSGTTSLAAKNLHRNSIGYEINDSFLPVISKKIDTSPNSLFNMAHLEIIRPERAARDFKEEIQKLPYIFFDPIKFDKKVDPRKVSFGSKFNGKEMEETSFFKIKRLISPNIIELSNDLTVRLLGVCEKKGFEAKAMEWLEAKLKGQNLSIKFDKIKYDDKNLLLSYLYLKNKTFINLHLLRTKFVEIDKSIPFRYEDKFRSVLEKSFFPLSRQNHEKSIDTAQIER